VAKYFDKIDSTQRGIKQFLPKTGEGIVLCIAETQSKAVGRHGRPWASPVGGIWFTLALPLGERPLTQVGSFSPVVAVQIVEALKEVNNLQCSLKWPNDIFYDDKKLAGVLIETHVKSKKTWVLLGIGINVNNTLPADLQKTATTIAAVRKQSQGRSRLIEAILGKIHEAWREYDRTGFGPYHKAVETNMNGVGKTAKILVGDTTIQGVVTGIDPQGGLLLKSGTGVKTIHAGEIVGQPT
jgi:BirA family biotin operon repressor/biotin-[acetyl-CoA-carboxylase] ligase